MKAYNTSINYTLSQLTQEFLDTYQITDTWENNRAVRTKIVRTLEKLGFYSTLLEISNKNNQPITISREIKREIETAMRYYLIKKSNMRDEEKTKYINYLENRKNVAHQFREQHSNHTPHKTVVPPTSKIPQQELDSSMIQALFQVFYTPIDTEKWIADKKMIAEHDGNLDLSLLKALERTSNPHLHYTKRRRDI